ncbi:galactose-specific lectin nattectin-like isoform X2 [Alosa pseudoharengus]|uniref:galactose-specific lectin nattectin-like isoform X2 n=1 Tax=Alosa pseudoharengus TaxID=34774 RepID=UPI003F8888E5
MHPHRTDDQDEEQHTAGKLGCNHGARSKVKLVLPVLIPGLLLLTVVITAHVVAHRTGYFMKECQTPDVKSNSTAGCRSGKCNNGWEAHGGQCYFFSNKNLSWTLSEEECVHKKSHLAIINDEKEQKLLMGISAPKMQFPEDKFWIGLNDRQTEGEWLWVDNTPLTNKGFWLENEPDNWKGVNNQYPDGEDCVRMGVKNFIANSAAAGWVDTACERKYKFICETEACL